MFLNETSMFAPFIVTKCAPAFTVRVTSAAVPTTETELVISKGATSNDAPILYSSPSFCSATA